MHCSIPIIIYTGEYNAENVFQINPGRCCLCHETQCSYTHLPNMQQQHVLCLQKFECLNPTACICRRCVEDICKHGSKPDYIPVWERARHVKGRRGCDVVSCAKEGSKCTTLAPSTIISQLLEVELSCQQTGENTCLCLHHYRFTYL